MTRQGGDDTAGKVCVWGGGWGVERTITEKARNKLHGTEIRNGTLGTRKLALLTSCYTGLDGQQMNLLHASLSH